jgi:hypothetical protein
MVVMFPPAPSIAVIIAALMAPPMMMPVVRINAAKGADCEQQDKEGFLDGVGHTGFLSRDGPIERNTSSFLWFWRTRPSREVPACLSAAAFLPFFVVYPPAAALRIGIGE